MLLENRLPTHPGEILLEECLTPVVATWFIRSSSESRMGQVAAFF